jgi:hypothetical protein
VDGDDGDDVKRKASRSPTERVMEVGGSPLLSTRVVKVAVTWPGPDGPSALVSTGGTKEEWPGPEGRSALVSTGGTKEEVAMR